MEIRELPDVFGVSRETPLTYQERTYVDDKFRDSLKRDKHIVVFGGSKQGKTCLRKHILNTQDYEVVQCNNRMTTSSIYKTLLIKAGASIDVLEKIAISGNHKVSASFGLKGKFPGLGEMNGDTRYIFEKKGDERESSSFEIDLGDVNEVIRVLEQASFTKRIVIEDFHYLTPETQKDFAIDLKAFHEKTNTCSFIIVGVWQESNRLILHNGDLTGRLIPIDADVWEENDLREVIRNGEILLNVCFSDKVKDEMILNCQGNIGLLQEGCYRFCSESSVLKTLTKNTEIDNEDLVTQVFNNYAKEQSGRYQNFLTELAQEDKESHIFKWISYVLITATTQDLKRGLSVDHILKSIEQSNLKPPVYTCSFLIDSLKRINEIQNKNRIQSIILDYNSNENTLMLVDSGFILFTEAIEESRLLSLINV